MKNFVLTAVLVLLVSFCGRPSCAQFNADTPPAFSLYLADQAGDEENTPRPYYADRPTDTTIKTQNPTAALFKSMFIPGWGQIGNKKYIKAGVIIALESSLIVTLVHYADKTSDARKLFDAAVDEEEKARLFEEYRDAKDERNRSKNTVTPRMSVIVFHGTRRQWFFFPCLTLLSMRIWPDSPNVMKNYR